jgi:hypothetical protein
MNHTVHEAQIKLAFSIPRVEEQATEAKQSLKQDREDKDKAKHEPVGVVNCNGNTVILKQSHYRQEEPYKVKSKGPNVGQKCEVCFFTLVSITCPVCRAQTRTHSYGMPYSLGSTIASHLSKTRPMLSSASVSHSTLHPIPEYQYPLYQIQIYSLYRHGVSTI